MHIFLFQKSISYCLFFSFFLNFNQLNAQEEEGPAFSIVCDGKQQQAVLYEEEKKDIVFYLSKNKIYAENSLLEITNLSKKDIKDQIRNFSIFNKSEWVIEIPPVKKNRIFCLKIAELMKQLSPGTYVINTMAIPSDPELAKLVKPARVEVFTLIIQ